MYEQIYNLTSMFFKSLKGNLMYEFLISKFNGKRGPQRKLSLEQIVALNIYRFHFKMGDLKNYHKMIKELMSDKVPNLPNYENFMKATNKSTVFILAFMNFLMEMNRKKESEIHYMDSTPITVCMNHKIYSHKVTKVIARRSKSTKGWWYGFKMSGICNEQGDFENIIFSYANIADCKIAEKLAEVVKGTIFADAGYLQKKDVLKRMEEDGIKFEAEALLTSCYEKSLNLAKEKGLKTIAFPLISAGVYGYPQKDAIRVAIEMMKLHQDDFDEITLVLFGEREFEFAREMFPEFIL